MIKNVQQYRFVMMVLLIMPVYVAARSTSGQVIATIAVGDSPAGIAITPDNRFAYVADNNNDDLPNGNAVSVIDLRSNTVIETINDPSFNQPYTITINAAGSIAYVTNSSGSTVSLIDTATNEVTGTIGGFDGPSGFVITPQGNRAYVNNYGGPIAGSGNGITVNVVDLTTNTIIDIITVGLAPASLAITPDGAFVYVINYVDGNPGTGTASVIRTSDNIVVATIPGFSGPFGIAITPNGKYAYVTNFGSNNFAPTGSTVSVIDLSTNTISATISVGTQPSGVAITPNGRFVYVSNYNTLYLGPNFTDLTPGQGTVYIIDACTNRLLCPVIIVGESPANIAISPNGRRAYVSNYSSNNVSVIDIVDRMWLCN
jgi:YVTN family beta-propeller protein